MNPLNHHLVKKPEMGASIDELIANCALGQLPRPLDVLVKSHIALKPASQAYFHLLETSAANEIFCQEASGQVSSRQGRLENIFASKPTHEHHVGDVDEVFPGALYNYVGKSLAEIPWRWRLPGIKQYKIETAEGYEASLLWVKPGRKMPAHTHDGVEATLVLKGSFGDAHENYERGDVSIADCDVDHSPKAGHEEDCICLIVTDGPLRLTGSLGHFFHKIFG